MEFEEYCVMTHRQRVLYQRIKNKISTKDLFQLAESKAKMENLMNLVMQFRKVCNHPELFERRVGRIPFSFRALQHGMTTNPAFSSQPDIRASMKNPISFEIPKIIFDECFLITDNMTQLFRRVRKNVDNSFVEVGFDTHMRFFNIFNALNMSNEIFNSGKSGSFGILRLLQKSNRWSLGDISYLFVADPMVKQIALMHYYN
jgi:SNF2 family DNA or RNA helicase